MEVRQLKAGEKGDLKVLLMGRIPFEDIEFLDPNGDEYYGFPHIYCHFDAKKREPYEKLIFCVEKRDPYHSPSYVEVAPYEQVRRLSKRLGIDASL